MGVIVIRTRYDEGTESAEVATSAILGLLPCFTHFYFRVLDLPGFLFFFNRIFNLCSNPLSCFYYSMMDQYARKKQPSKNKRYMSSQSGKYLTECAHFTIYTQLSKSFYVCLCLRPNHM